MVNKDAKIGVFDSGIGGLTVLKELMNCMPDENFLYLADLKNSPYGEKKGEEIEKFSRNIIKYFIKKEVKAIVIACNTASSYNIDKIKNDYKIPIFTVLDAAVNEVYKYNNILLAATPATCNAGRYRKKIIMKNKNANIYEQPCKDIVPIMESGEYTEEEEQNIVNSYISKYKNINLDVLLLGCTHYPIWSKYFRNSIGEDVFILNPTNILSNEVKQYLLENNLLSENSINNTQYLVTDNLEKFFINSNKIIKGIKRKDIKLINIESE